MFLTLKSLRKQYQSIKTKQLPLHSNKTSTVNPLICFANQMTGFYMTATLAFNGLNTHQLIKPSLFLVFICLFWSLIWNMNGLRHKYFSVWSNILQLFCHEVQTANATLSVVKNSWNGNFADFIVLKEKKIGFADLV